MELHIAGREALKLPPAQVKGIQEDGRWGLGSGSLAGYEARKILVASWYLYFKVGR